MLINPLGPYQDLSFHIIVVLYILTYIAPCLHFNGDARCDQCDWSDTRWWQARPVMYIGMHGWYCPPVWLECCVGLEWPIDQFLTVCKCDPSMRSQLTNLTSGKDCRTGLACDVYTILSVCDHNHAVWLASGCRPGMLRAIQSKSMITVHNVG